MHATKVINKPIISEKGTILQAKQDYIFNVNPKATKHEIKLAVEKIFKVKVTKVNVMNVPGKQKLISRRRVMTASFKKAVVTLAPGDKIVYFEGV
jgi:large subunit ribosomal protein L23